MDLNYDWCRFQDVFSPQHRTGKAVVADGTAPIFCVIEKDIVLSAYSDHEDLRDLSGMLVSDVKARYSNRDVLLIERSELESWHEETCSHSQFYSQIEQLRKKAHQSFIEDETKGKVGSAKLAKAFSKEHFFIQAIKGWWRKIFPSSYVFFIRIEGQTSQDLVITVRDGNIEMFHKPDFSSLGAEGVRDPRKITKYLSERYLLPAQTLFVSEADWANWSSMADPWEDIHRALKTKKASLVPYGWGLWVLLKLRSQAGF